MNNNECISDEAMMRFIAAAFALNGILSATAAAGAPAPDAAAKMSINYANALMSNLKKSKKQMQE